MKQYIRLATVALILIAAVCGWFIYSLRTSPEASRTAIHKSRIADVKAVAQLCTVDFYEDYPIRGSVGNKHIFARMTLTGSISFDIDSLDIGLRGDTLIVTLPPETVTVRESTDSDAYEIIDTWNDSFLGSSTLSTAEENEIKTKAIDRFKRHIYAKGHVRRARAEAVGKLSAMLSTVYGKPVIVSDPTPDGTVW